MAAALSAKVLLLKGSDCPISVLSQATRLGVFSKESEERIGNCRRPKHPERPKMVSMKLQHLGLRRLIPDPLLEALEVGNCTLQVSVQVK